MANEMINQVVSKINGAENVLVALSSNPSVDEMAAAIGLTMFLDKMGKHATAIYSGETPNALEFLRPKETFESNTSSLQDFIIALDKEKADHLRYKVDGAFVKVYVTPYRTTLSENDFEFSHGDFNVDLVVALNVKTATDLDGALREHGRIMHDASAINISAGEPGKFGELEWSDVNVSSVSEMIANLAFALQSKTEMDKDIATALLTGIVANTNHFSNEKTTPSTMNLSAKLMQAGADQQLISQNVTAETAVASAAPAAPQDDSDLSINHGQEAEAPASEPASEPVATEPVATEPVVAPVNEGPQASAPAEVPVPTLDGELMKELKRAAEGVDLEPMQPAPTEAPVDYGKMMDEALAEPLPGAPESNSGFLEEPSQNLAASVAPEVPTAVDYNDVPAIDYQPVTSDLPMPGDGILPPPPTPPVNFEESVLETPESVRRAMPTIQPLSEQPAPIEAAPVEAAPVQNIESIQPAGMAPTIPELPPVDAPLTPLGNPAVNQVMQDQTYNDPSAFKIPGM